MITAGFDHVTQVYLATGLLTYSGGNEALSKLSTNMKHKGLCSEIYHKEQFLEDPELQSLHSEQKALVDLLILARANRFVGFEPSTFSFFVSQYRILLGLDPKSSVSVEGAVMTTNPLFEAAAVVTNDLPQFQLPQRPS